MVVTPTLLLVLPILNLLLLHKRSHQRLLPNQTLPLSHQTLVLEVAVLLRGALVFLVVESLASQEASATQVVNQASRGDT